MNVTIVPGSKDLGNQLSIYMIDLGVQLSVYVIDHASNCLHENSTPM